MAHNPEALERTLTDVDLQLKDARDRGDFTKAEELHATLSGLKASVAQAKEDIVDGKFQLEASILEQQRTSEARTVARGMRHMENDVNMHIEAQVADLERIHQKERAELEQLLQDKVKLEFTPTPEMLRLKSRVEHLLKTREFSKAEVARRDLINQEQKDRRLFAEALWRSWGCRRNKLAYKQSIERARCESDVASRKSQYQVDRKASQDMVERKHRYNMQSLQEKYTNINNAARNKTRNAKLRLPPVAAGGGIPVSEAADEVLSETALCGGPQGRVLVKGWVFKRSNQKIQLAGKENGRPASSGERPPARACAQRLCLICGSLLSCLQYWRSSGERARGLCGRCQGPHAARCALQRSAQPAGAVLTAHPWRLLQG